jgi:nucleotide-binding universal stress UspA family protein
LSFPYKKILCAVDFDDHSTQAINEAAALAQHSAAILYLLHVVKINPLVAQGAAEGLASKEFYDAQVEAARQQLEQLTQSIRSGVESEIAVEIGEPADSILAARQRSEADLLVVATHGRRGLKRLVLGSVAEKVVRESLVPVLTVRSAPSKDAS